MTRITQCFAFHLFIIQSEAYLRLAKGCVLICAIDTVPELRIYRFWEKPVGPHPYPMFEVNLFTPAQFGAFIPWLVIHRGQLSVLVHPNTDEPGSHWGNELRNHTARATWLGDKVPLDLTEFYRSKQQESGQEERHE